MRGEQSTIRRSRKDQRGIQFCRWCLPQTPEDSECEAVVEKVNAQLLVLAERLMMRRSRMYTVGTLAVVFEDERWAPTDRDVF